LRTCERRRGGRGGGTIDFQTQIIFPPTNNPSSAIAGGDFETKGNRRGKEKQARKSFFRSEGKRRPLKNKKKKAATRQKRRDGYLSKQGG